MTRFRGYLIAGPHADFEPGEPERDAQEGDVIEADGQEWRVVRRTERELEVGCLGCEESGFEGWRVYWNDDGGHPTAARGALVVERCDACKTFDSDDEAYAASVGEASNGLFNRRTR